MIRHVYNDPILKERRQTLRRGQTASEKILWNRLRNRQLNGVRFFRQYSVGPYILDFYCPSVRLAIELDGAHHTEAEIKKYDEDRSSYLHSHNIQVIRFRNADIVERVQAVLEKIADRLASSTVTPS